jgi:hypothetical protein
MKKNRLVLLLPLFFILFSVGQSSAAEISNSSPGLIGVWHFNDAITDRIATDSGPNALNATCVDANCPSFSSSGKYGGAYQFDGRTDYLVVPNASVLNPVTGITISAWVNSSDFTTNRRIMQKGGLDNQYRLASQAGNLTFKLQGTSAGILYSALPGLNGWHHIVATYDKSKMKMYLDGVLVNQANSFNNIATTTDNLFIGTKNTTTVTGDYYYGLLDEVGLWNRALSDAEIQQLAIDASVPVCGDGTCNGTETCSTCSGDCGSCQITPVCGNGICESGETSSACPLDCSTSTSTCYDTTSDNKVNVLDLAYIGSKFGSTDTKADISKDGLVDVADLVLVSGNFGACTPIVTPDCTIGSQITSACVCNSLTYTTGYCCSTGYSTTACTTTPITVSASPTSTSFTTSQTVTLSSSDATATIYYTTNGTTPTTSSSVYSAPLTFISTTTLKFFAVKGTQQSSIGTVTYTKVIPGALQASITMDESQWYKDNIKDFTLTSGYAPLPVFFEGWQSSPRDEIVEYMWDFGDSFSKGANSNSLEGFNAAHVFEQPGTYIVTLTVKNSAGQKDSRTITVNALPRDGNIYYVDSAIGDDTLYDGKCPTLQASCGPWKTATKVFAKYIKDAQPGFTPGDTIYFKCSQTFELAGIFTYGHGPTRSVLFSTEPNCAQKPVIQYTGIAEGSLLKVLSGWGYLSFVDLVFNLKSTDQSKPIISLFTGDAGKNLLFLRTEVNEPNNGIVKISGSDGRPNPSGVFIIDSKVTNETTYGRSQIQIWGHFSKLALIGDVFDKSGNHNAYLSTINKGIITKNVFSRPAQGRDALRIDGHYDPYDTSISTNNVHIIDNFMLGWVNPILCNSTGACTCPSDVDICNPSSTTAYASSYRYNFFGVEMAPNVATSPQSIENILFERNVVANFETGIILTSVENLTVKNNLLITPSDYPAGSFVNFSYRFVTRPSKNVKLIGNTFARVKGTAHLTNYGYRTPAIVVNSYTGLPYNGQAQHENIEIKNNLAYYQAGDAIAVSVSENNAALLSQLFINNNLYYSPGTLRGLLAGGIITYDDWKNLGYGFDLNSIAPNVNPSFGQAVNFPVYGAGQPSFEENVAMANAYKGMFRVSPSSPAIDKGHPYPNQLYYDFSKTIRPRGNGFDIGAFEVN